MNEYYNSAFWLYNDPQKQKNNHKHCGNDVGQAISADILAFNFCMCNHRNR